MNTLIRKFKSSIFYELVASSSVSSWEDRTVHSGRAEVWHHLILDLNPGNFPLTQRYLFLKKETLAMPSCEDGAKLKRDDVSEYLNTLM